MKKIFLLLTSVCLFSSILTEVQAATYMWTGGAGDNNWNTAGNWDNGVPTGADAIIVVNNGGAITGAVNSWADGSMTITGNTTVTITNKSTLGNVTIDKGSVVNISAGGDCKGKLDINGTLNLGSAVGYWMSVGNEINLNQFGLITRSGGGQWWPELQPSVQGVLDVGSSSPTADYQVFTRILIDGCNGLTINLTNSIFKGLDGSALNKVAGKSDIVADADHANNYYVYMDGTTLKVDYVKGSVSVPEPTTASLALLGAMTLFLRRRLA